MRRILNKGLARLAGLFPSFGERLVRNYQAQQMEGTIPWAPVTKALAESRIALVTTSGIHHRSQTPFDMSDSDGDPSFRELMSDNLFNDFTISHDYYDHRDALKDPNIVLPLDRLREWVEEGIVGRLSPRHFGFMGHVDGPHIPTLIKNGAEIGQQLKNDQVDLVLLTPS